MSLDAQAGAHLQEWGVPGVKLKSESLFLMLANQSHEPFEPPSSPRIKQHHHAGKSTAHPPDAYSSADQDCSFRSKDARPLSLVAPEAAALHLHKASRKQGRTLSFWI